MSDILLIETDEFEIRGEVLWFGVILHADVKVFYSKSVQKRFREAVRLISRCLSKPVYAFQTPSHDPLKRKFIQSMGGVLDHYRTTPEGERAEMYLFRPLD